MKNPRFVSLAKLLKGDVVGFTEVVVHHLGEQTRLDEFVSHASNYTLKAYRETPFFDMPSDRLPSSHTAATLSPHSQELT